MKIFKLFLIASLTMLIGYNVTHAHGIIKVHDTTIHIIHGDIVQGTYNDGSETFNVEAIVNAANRQLARGGGVCGAIFQAAEGDSTVLQSYIDEKYPEGIKTGQAVITPSFRLQKKGIKHIIHAVGPIYNEYEDKSDAKKLLRNAYINSLKVAEENKLSSIAFPFISSAIYGYPKPEAAQIAIDAIQEYCMTAEKNGITDIYMVLFSNEDYQIFSYTKILK